MISFNFFAFISKYDINADNPSTDWSVQLGVHRLFEGGQRHYISDIFVHSTYNYSFVTYGTFHIAAVNRCKDWLLKKYGANEGLSVSSQKTAFPLCYRLTTLSSKLCFFGHKSSSL